MLEQFVGILVLSGTEIAPTLQNNVFQIFDAVCHDSMGYLQSRAKNIDSTKQLQTVEDTPFINFITTMCYLT
jgi:hypothetical protein